MDRPETSERRWRPALILSTRLGQRFAALFVLCALVPVGIFGVLADRAVSAELLVQAHARVQRAGKDASMSILQQLESLDQQLAVAVRANGDATQLPASEPRIRSIDTLALATFTGAEQARLREGRPLLRVARRQAEGDAQLELLRLVSAPVSAGANPLNTTEPVGDDSVRAVRAVINLKRLVGGVSGLDLVPPASRLCLSIAGTPLGCLSAIDAGAASDSPFVGESRVFLRYLFGAPDLQLAISESPEVALAPLVRFRDLFIPIALGAVCLAALVSQITIRRQTEPLFALDAGTKRIAAGDFSHHVTVTSDDELGELATAFNGMTEQLNRQFNTLELRHDVDVAVLGAGSRREVIDVVLSRIRAVVACDHALLLVPPPGAGDAVGAGWRVHCGRADASATDVTLSEAERLELIAVDEIGFAVASGSHRSYLTSLSGARAEVYPVRVRGVTEGALILGCAGTCSLTDEERRRVRQLVAQVAVAFSNLHLVDELRALNSGALEALARTTDAASPWTAGHSVRVTAIAVALAQADGLDEATVDLVQRGALLHDIGKLAVPVAILDKPAALTPEERAVMNTHPVVGARILAPVAAFAPLLPMVRSHHERWDGRGYPDQLRGEEIAPLARLLAVADVAESMLAARPYRAPLPLEYVVQFIRDNAGTHFDPHFALLFAERVAARDAGLMQALAASSSMPAEPRLRDVA